MNTSLDQQTPRLWEACGTHVWLREHSFLPITQGTLSLNGTTGGTVALLSFYLILWHLVGWIWIDLIHMGKDFTMGVLGKTEEGPEARVSQQQWFSNVWYQGPFRLLLII